jgi:MPBQ/MSBQ methyltransferase
MWSGSYFREQIEMVDYPDVRAYLQHEYKDIFPSWAIERHYQQYVELEMSRKQLVTVQSLTALKPGDRLLDLGSGFGSFVVVCREAGIEAEGLDIGEYQTNFAHERFSQVMPGLDPAQIYYQRDAQSTGLSDGRYDVITAWNLLEHVPDYRRVIGEAYRMLKPGGVFMGVAPNYLALRREAHYQVLWLPLFPRPLARAYLRRLGRRTDFLDTSLFYITNLGALTALHKTGFRLQNPQLLKFERPELIASPGTRRLVKWIEEYHLMPLVKSLLRLNLWNPLKSAIYFVGKKPL